MSKTDYVPLADLLASLPAEQIAQPDALDSRIEALLDEIDPYRHEQGHDAATTRALYALARKLLQEGK
jgi:hypothetical protein